MQRGWPGQLGIVRGAWELVVVGTLCCAWALAFGLDGPETEDEREVVGHG